MANQSGLKNILIPEYLPDETSFLIKSGFPCWSIVYDPHKNTFFVKIFGIIFKQVGEQEDGRTDKTPNIQIFGKSSPRQIKL
jgi:hypothetical protein